MKIAAALLACLLTTQLQAEKPVPKIDGPTKARTGDIIILDASGSTATHFHWLVDSSGVRLPEDGVGNAKTMAEKLRALGFKVQAPADAKSTHHVVLEGGKKIILASYPGTWRVVLAAGNSEGVDQLAWTLVVAGNGPQPPPNGDDEPEPPKPPGPEPPPLKTDFSAEAKQWLATVPPASRNLKDDQGRTVQQNLQETLNEIGSVWKEAGSIKAMEGLLGVGIQASLKPLGAKAKDWTKFAESANATLDGLKNKGATPAQYGAALISIAEGLR